jgi:hypothetical protein
METLYTRTRQTFMRQINVKPNSGRTIYVTLAKPGKLANQPNWIYPGYIVASVSYKGIKPSDKLDRISIPYIAT